MNIFKRSSLRTALMAAMLALACSACAIITAPELPAPVVRTAAAGATHCATSSDGKMVACGGTAAFCQVSSDGKMVACGGAQ